MEIVRISDSCEGTQSVVAINGNRTPASDIDAASATRHLPISFASGMGCCLISVSFGLARRSLVSENSEVILSKIVRKLEAMITYSSMTLCSNSPWNTRLDKLILRLQTAS